MISFRRRTLVFLLGLSDLTLLSLSLYVAVFGRGALASWTVVANKDIQVHTILALALLLFIWKSTFSLIGLYQSKRLSPQLTEIVDLLQASVIATFALATIALVFGVLIITPEAIARFFVISTFCLILSHLLMRQALKSLRMHGRNLRNLVIIGTNERAVRFGDSVLARPEFGYRLVGFVDDIWVGPHPHPGISSVLVSDIAGFRSYLRTQVIDEVAIALPIKSFYEQECELLEICHEQGVIVRMLSDMFQASTRRARYDELGSLPVVTFFNTPTESVELAAKRALDIVGSALLILFMSPLLLATWILVKLDSEGPVIFAQERIGLNKRRFRIYKFRSMVVNAERLQANLEERNEAQGPVFKIKEDPRITRIGKFLRKTSIDELPQLFNVLMGDMSLVGPRPLPIRDYSGFNKDWQRRRFGVRPGITCLWQISGRSSISFDQWMLLDLEYIDQWSLWLDMKILVRTIPVVLRGTGAA
jgi:exopolysaccharide biosynthesis polyprenyl glycosylphosphotransferase